MPKESAVFSDMDGTLFFHDKVHGIRRTGTSKHGKALVRTPDSSNEIKAFEIDHSGYKAYIAAHTREVAHALREVANMYVVTAARKSTMQLRKPTLDFASGFVLESGASICDPDLNEDAEWHDLLKPERIVLEEMKRYLWEKKNLTLDVEGRHSAIRIRHDDNSDLDPDDFEELNDSLVLPDGLKKTRNLGHIDIILASAGKDSAVHHIRNKKGYKKKHTYGVGDDINDIPLFEATGHGLLLGNAFPEAISFAKENGLYISEGKYFDGINEIIEEIHNRVI